MEINPTQASILGLLHSIPMNGHTLNETAQKWLGPYWSMTRSQVYRELTYLGDHGMLAASAPGQRGSVTYSITKLGKREFQKWLNTNAHPDPLRSEVVVRVAFGALHSSGRLNKMVNFATKYHNDELQRILDLKEEAGKDGLEWDAAALEWAAGYHEWMLSWLLGHVPAED